MSAKFGSLFSALPEGLRNDLETRFDEIVKNYHEQRWEPSELNGGKLCEAVYTILEGLATNSYRATAYTPRNMENACQQLANYINIPDSARLSIPRAIVALYDVRNRRGVGHVGGDVNPNHMDALYVLSISKWILAELIRVYNDTTTQEALQAVEELSQREMPLIWSSAAIVRVLTHGLSKKDETLLLLYAADDGTLTEKNLIKYIEHSNSSIYRRDVLIPNHKKRLWEYSKDSGIVTLLPPGIEAAEKIIQKYSQHI